MSRRCRLLCLQRLCLGFSLSIAVIVVSVEPPINASSKAESKAKQPPSDTTITNRSNEQPVPVAPKVIANTAPPTSDKAVKAEKEPEQAGYDWSKILPIFISLAALIVSIFAWKASYDRNALERPWMMFRPGDPNSGIVSAGAQTPAVIWPLPVMYQGLFVVPWNAINVGRSPAFLTRLVARIEVVNTGSVPPALTGGSDFPNYIISPKTPPDDRFGTNLVRSLTQEESIDIQNGDKRVWVYGAVEYRGFRRRNHATRFCCIWYVDNGANTYDPVGPPGWTDYT